jgi:phospholipase/carboxylesterase
MAQITKHVSGNFGSLEPGEPVVLFLHGYGADERDLPELMTFLPKLPWVSLRAPEPSQFPGFAWYSVENPLDPDEIAITEATEKIWNWVDANLPEDSPLILLGFSQGALMATQLLRTRPSRVMATVILAGFIYGGELPGDATLLANKPKVIYCRGLQDTVVTREATSRLNVWLQQHTRAITRTYDGLGHSIDQRVMADVAEYLEGVLANRG